MQDGHESAGIEKRTGAGAADLEVPGAGLA